MNINHHFPSVDVIIPVKNERENLKTLIERVDKTLRGCNVKHSIIVVDNRADAAETSEVAALSAQYPVKLVRRENTKGPGAAVMQGFSQSTGDAVVFIDSDSAYSPELIPHLLRGLLECDVVVGGRVHLSSKKVFKKTVSRLLQFFVGKTIFGLDIDMQSGLIVVRRSVLNLIQLNTLNWAFETELILRSYHAGFHVKEMPIAYNSSETGKKSLFLSALELMLIALYFRINIFEPTVLHQEDGDIVGYNKQRFMPYTSLNLAESAVTVLSKKQTKIFLAALVIASLLFTENWHLLLVITISFITLLYFMDILFNVFLVFRSLRKDPSIAIPKKIMRERTDWPLYTIVCPLYKEWEVAPQFINAISKLDYPKDKIQLLLALEEDDTETIAAISKMKLPAYCEILIVPHSLPKTKPKACNYALHHARGEYLVVYDAEDIPEPYQLKKAVIAFDMLKKEHVVCLQAKLAFYNSKQNLLTRMFSLEYSLWFDLILTGLHSIDAPIPLGGTSNHFPKKYLDLLSGWDPFNVAEDCDLGIRLFKYGYRTKILSSYTYEEANSNFIGWFKQRSRWVKGYIQTYLVHMRSPRKLLGDWSNFHILTFQMIVGAKVLSMWINPLLWVMTFVYFAFRSRYGAFIESLYLGPIFYMGVTSLIFGNFFYLYNYMIAAAKKKQWLFIKYAYLVPFYWLMMSYSSWIALQQLLFKPHYWEKTKHGLHLNNKNALKTLRLSPV